MLKITLTITTITIVALALLTVLNKNSFMWLDDAVETFKRHAEYEEGTAHVGEG